MEYVDVVDHNRRRRNSLGENEYETEMTWNTHGAGRNGMKKAVNIAFIQVVTFTEPFSAHSARAPFLANEAICSLIKLS